MAYEKSLMAELEMTSNFGNGISGNEISGNEISDEKKQPYQSPKLHVFGDIAGITKSNGVNAPGDNGMNNMSS